MWPPAFDHLWTLKGAASLGEDGFKKVDLKKASILISALTDNKNGSLELCIFIVAY